MLWGSSYYVVIHDVAKNVSSGWLSLFIVGMTVGRFLVEFLSMHLRQRNLIYIGVSLIFSGLIFTFVNGSHLIMLFSLIIFGFGCAHLFPVFLHETPHLFGKDKSQIMMEIQMASEYLGTTFMTLLFGVKSKHFGFEILPLYLLILCCLLILMIVIVYSKASNKANV